MNEEALLLQRSWQRCWQGLAANGDGAQWMAALLAAYREPQRHYHSVQHLRECLALFEAHGGVAHHPHEVEMALWFHDAVYDVQAVDNEARSAAWALAVLAAAGVADDCCQRIHDHIMATCHTAQPVGADQQLLVDIDLAILGASSARFQEYQQQIRAEYDWVPEALFQQKRRAILMAFQAQSPLYGTASLQQALAQNARGNLAAALAVD